MNKYSEELLKFNTKTDWTKQLLIKVSMEIENYSKIYNIDYQWVQKEIDTIMDKGFIYPHYKNGKTHYDRTNCRCNDKQREFLKRLKSYLHSKFNR